MDRPSPAGTWREASPRQTGWHRLGPAVAAAGLVLAPVAAPAAAGPGDPGGPALQRPLERRVILRAIDPFRPLPVDLLDPEGKSRWDLSSLTGGRSLDWRVRASGGRATSLLASAPADAEQRRAPEATGNATGRAVALGQGTRYRDLDDGAAAARWLFPDRFRETLRPGQIQYLHLDERTGPRRSRLWIRLETVGIGWLLLASGPREVALQRALILREPGESRGYAVESLVHRWVDPRAGIVAEVSGPASPDGRRRRGITGVRLVEQVSAGAASLRIFVDDIEAPPHSRVLIGWDAGEDAGVPVSTLMSSAPATIGDLIAGTPGPGGVPLWDFSMVTSARKEIFSTSAPLTPAETCNHDECGYTQPGVTFAREDKFIFSDTSGTPINPPDIFKIHTVNELEQRVLDVTIWLRAGTVNEGKDASSVAARDGESRICYADEPALGISRSAVPLWRFVNNDGQDNWFMQAGDPRWSSGVFQCEQNIDNRNCGAPPPGFPLVPADLYIRDCNDNFPRTGTQYGEVVDAGVIKLPSGHFLNALLVRTVADFCLYTSNDCTPGFLGLNKIDEARTVNYIWVAPEFGTVARLQSPQRSEVGCPQGADPDICFTDAVETDIKFGLFPPLSISVTGVTDTSVFLSWNPGLDTHRIGRYRIYWDTESGGGADGWDFDSVNDPGMVSPPPGGPEVTSTTLTGLTPGTTYHITITSVLDFINPSCEADPGCNDLITYESLLFPTQVSGDPDLVYPVEVQAVTTGGTCTPTAEVTNLTAAMNGTALQLCWDPSMDPCLDGYQVLGATTPDSAAGFSPTAETGLTTCWSGTTNDTFFLAVTRGSGGTGPLGHFGL